MPEEKKENGMRKIRLSRTTNGRKVQAKCPLWCTVALMPRRKPIVKALQRMEDRRLVARLARFNGSGVCLQNSPDTKAGKEK